MEYIVLGVRDAADVPSNVHVYQKEFEYFDPANGYSKRNQWCTNIKTINEMNRIVMGGNEVTVMKNRDGHLCLYIIKPNTDIWYSYEDCEDEDDADEFFD